MKAAPAIDPLLEAAYNVRAAIPEHPAIFAGWRERSAAARAQLAWQEHAYGETPAQTLDCFPAGPGAPLQVFIHGGYWQALGKRDFSFIAAPWVARGVAVAVLDYALCPAVTLDEIVAQVRRALAWIHRHADRLAIDPARIQASGHSAGGHLLGMLLATDWVACGLAPPGAALHSAVSISGLFDLEPLRFTSINAQVGMDAAMAARNSPLLLQPTVRAPLLLAVGERESDGFHAQSRALAARWAQLPAAEYLSLPACHHLAAVEELGRGESVLFRRAHAMLGA